MQQGQTTLHQHRPSRQTSFAWTSKRYVRRSPESTLLYKVVQENFRSFEDLCALEGNRLPLHVTAEFEAFLKCGVLACGFLRFKSEDCKFERLVAFSCKKRGFCASCGARRMAETSLHLSNNVFAAATLIRQWVLSIPVPLRYMCARNPQLQGKILRLTNAVIAKSIKSSIPGLGLNHKKLQTGAVTLIQRFGGHVNLNIHFHMLHVQGAWEIRCPLLILGDSQTSISGSELKAIMSNLNVTKLTLSSHSGGFQGLVSLITTWDDSLKSKVQKLNMDDNFYSSSMASTLKQAFSREKLILICQGYYTAHAADRFNSNFGNFCPNVKEKSGQGAHRTNVKDYLY